MLPLKLKICGLNDEKNATAIINNIKPEYIGHIFHSKSKRYLASPFSETFYKNIPETKIVGVFVNEKIDIIVAKIKLFNLNVIQLHGNETLDYCIKLRNYIAGNIDIWKSITLLDTDGLKQIIDWKKHIDMFLFDSAEPQANNNMGVGGGTGIKWDWKLLDSYQLSLPFVLSGGISNDDISIINSLSKANSLLSVVDVNSKYEISPGIKNINNLKILRQGLI